jgi:hypothetical protein
MTLEYLPHRLPSLRYATRQLKLGAPAKPKRKVTAHPRRRCDRQRTQVRLALGKDPNLVNQLLRNIQLHSPAPGRENLRVGTSPHSTSINSRQTSRNTTFSFRFSARICHELHSLRRQV